ncbi:30S ribosomal protein S5 [Achlya hypogyna]|uniref:30S ribosomal protein S5 n=1 Tax=Achlya hypogyna TaxID=1202772 RepID=A0A1V9Z307_ACHHY|nr:30S ribosomal protein S5 [Achlya hypogyna]
MAIRNSLMLARFVSRGLSRRFEAASSAVPFRAFSRAADDDEDDEGRRRKKKNDDDLGLDLEEVDGPKKVSDGLEEFDEDEPLEPPPLYGRWKEHSKPFRQLAPAAARKHRYQAIAPKNMAAARRRLLDEFGARSMSFDDPQFVYDDSLRPDMGLLYEKDELDQLANDTEEMNFDEDDVLDLEAKGLVRQIIYVDTVQKPVTQGNILTFRALVCVGNQEGAAGYAVGRGQKINEAIERATIRAMDTMVYLDRFDDRTLFHEVRGKFNSCSLFIRPSKYGMGSTVSDTVGCALYCFGITDVVSKCYGQRNPYTVIKATFDALAKHETAEQVAMKTGHSVYEITNLAKHGKM